MSLANRVHASSQWCFILLNRHAPSKSIYVASPSPKLAVAVLAGGGSGHEPAHASYTGAGMLTVSVSGDIFASPSTKQILAAIQFAAFAGQEPSFAEKPQKNRDVLAVINNYTGDRLHFGVAMEKARAANPDLNIMSVVVSDDISLINRPSMVGARGLAGNILVCKVLGAAAERGWGLEKLKRLGDSVVANLASVGVGLDHCHVPGRKVLEDTDAMDEDNRPLGGRECEIGMGLHNEPGVKKVKIESSEALIGDLVELVLSSKEGGFVRHAGKADEVVLFVNNLGGISLLEMGAVVDETLTQLGMFSAIKPIDTNLITVVRKNQHPSD